MATIRTAFVRGFIISPSQKFQHLEVLYAMGVPQKNGLFHGKFK